MCDYTELSIILKNYVDYASIVSLARTCKNMQSLTKYILQKSFVHSLMAEQPWLIKSLMAENDLVYATDTGIACGMLLAIPIIKYHINKQPTTLDKIEYDIIIKTVLNYFGDELVEYVNLLEKLDISPAGIPEFMEKIHYYHIPFGKAIYYDIYLPTHNFSNIVYHLQPAIPFTYFRKLAAYLQSRDLIKNMYSYVLYLPDFKEYLSDPSQWILDNIDNEFLFCELLIRHSRDYNRALISEKIKQTRYARRLSPYL